MIDDRVPPHDADLEATILASMLIAPECIPTCLQNGLIPDDFYSTENKLVCTGIIDTFNRGKSVDIMTVADNLATLGALEAAGGHSRLVGLMEACRSTPNPNDWINGLQRLSRRRRIIATALNLADRAYDDTDESVVDDAGQVMIQAAQGSAKSRVYHVKDLVGEFFASMEVLSKGGSLGIPTGFSDLDSILGGLFPSDFIIVAGRPSMGKTAFGLGLAANIAVNSKKKIVFFSLEMSKEQVIQRLIVRGHHLSLHAVRTGKLPQRDHPKLSLAAGAFYESDLYVADTPGINLSFVRSVCSVSKPDVIIIDYLQLMSGDRVAGESRQQEIGRVSRGLKGIAKDFYIPVVALAQVSRAAEARGGDHKPQLSDLREAGDIENDADVVMFCYRGEYYFPNKEELKGRAELIVGKQRNGPPGIAELAWHAPSASFENLSHSESWTDGF